MLYYVLKWMKWWRVTWFLRYVGWSYRFCKIMNAATAILIHTHIWSFIYISVYFDFRYVSIKCAKLMFQHIFRELACTQSIHLQFWSMRRKLTKMNLFKRVFVEGGRLISINIFMIRGRFPSMLCISRQGTNDLFKQEHLVFWDIRISVIHLLTQL